VRTHTERLESVRPAVGFGTPIEQQARMERQLGKAVAMRQFGVNHLTLAPGAVSSRRHWHEGEDEFVYVLSGMVVLRDENGEHELSAGAFAGFPAGAPNAHQLINRSSGPAELLVVGSRKVGEERIHYPDEADPGPFTVLRDESGDRVR
jgi:uncharacterized cupin superfamily protein